MSGPTTWRLMNFASGYAKKDPTLRCGASIFMTLWGMRGICLGSYLLMRCSCRWVMPGNYDVGFTSCQGDSGMYASAPYYSFVRIDLTLTSPMGLYPQSAGGTSTFYQGQSATPSGEPAPSTSDCTTLTSASLFTALPSLAAFSVPTTDSAIASPTPMPTPTVSHSTTVPTAGSGMSIWESSGWNAQFASLVGVALSLSMIA